MRGFRRRLRRSIRKSRPGWLGLVVVLAILVFPYLFMGYVISPNDVFYNYDPWRSLVDAPQSQNPNINDPPTSWYTLMSLLREEPEAFHWNRYVGSGIPGYGATAAAVLSPFIAIPALLLPLWLVYGGIILLKIVVAHAGAWLWLRQSRAGKSGAGAGAVVLSCAGVYAVWWLWPGTNVTALYPVTLYLIRRAFDRQRVPLWCWWLLGVSYLLSGFPAPVVYFAWIAIAYTGFLMIRLLRFPAVDLARPMVAALLAIGFVSPGLFSFVRFLQRTGYLETRAGAAERLGGFESSHLLAFFDPFRLGDPIQHVWYGGTSASGNFVETTVYLGVFTIFFTVVGLLRRRAEGRFFWAVAASVVLAGIFVSDGLGNLLGALPGVGFSELKRLRVLLPIPAALLTAHGVGLLARLGRARSPAGSAPMRLGRWLALVAITLLAVDLGFFAGYFYPYLPPRLAKLPQSGMTSWIRSQEPPFRVLPTFDMYWPNTAELERFEDIRSHFGSEARYRQLMQRIDPESWGNSGTVLQVNGLTLDPADPILPLLNVRFVIEQPSIDILRWKVMEHTTPDQPMEGTVSVPPHTELRRELGAPASDVWALDVPVQPVRSGDGFVQIEIRRVDGSVFASRTRTSESLRRNEKFYVPLPRTGEPLELILRTSDFPVELAGVRGVREQWTFGWVRSPLIFRESFAEGRVFELLSSLPRYWAVWDIQRMSFEEMLAYEKLDFGRTAYVERNPGFDVQVLRRVPPVARRVNFELLSYDGRSEELRVRTAVPALIVASEKLVPEIRVTVDGEEVTPRAVNGLFWAIAVPAGEHLIVTERRVGRGWWPMSGASLALLVIAAIVDRRVRPRG